MVCIGGGVIVYASCGIAVACLMYISTDSGVMVCLVYTNSGANGMFSKQ